MSEPVLPTFSLLTSLAIFNVEEASDTIIPARLSMDNAVKIKFLLLSKRPS
ncbi:hypothetical protein BV097_01589 [Haemophilus influenzae]|nr:hypothetical protein BV094_00393 [Haemophilus influenzae]PRJ59426.1 hypothetical protein BV097_01589 [Haemophilus influenzae]